MSTVKDVAGAASTTFLINEAVSVLSIRYRGVSGPGNDLLIFERIDPAQEFPGGMPALADAIIKLLLELRNTNTAVHELMEGKSGVGIV